MKSYVLVFLGGGIGAMARYWLSAVVYRFLSPDFPYGNLAVNISGCLFIGVVMSVSETRMVDPPLRLFLTIGILGGFTTFSSFSYETIALLRDGQSVQAAVNVLATFTGCLVATAAGVALAKYF